MRKCSIVLLIVALLAAGWSPAWARDVGTVKRLQGEASAATAAGLRPLSVGSGIAEGDTLRTEADSRLEVTFKDGASLTLGEKAQVAVDEFVYGKEDGRAVLRVTEGAFRVVTGAIGRLPGKPFSVRTPHGVIGIRGTDFWGGRLGSVFDLLLLDGAVYLDTPQGRMDLTRPGAGVSIPVSGQAPSPPEAWSDERIGRAVATISFR